MKIHMLVLNDFTHDARVHREAKSLAAAGHDVIVFALWRTGLAIRESHDGYKVLRIPLRSRSFSNNLIGPVTKYLEFSYKLLEFARKTPPDVYHSHDANTLPAGWFASRQTDSLLVYDAHELETGRYFGASKLSPIYQRFWALPERAFIHRAHSVITVNESIAKELVNTYKILRPTVVMNCPEKTRIPKSNVIREMLGISTKERIVLYQGRVATGRGIEKLLVAVQQVPNAKAVILGDGPLLGELRQEVRTTRSKNVFLPGRIPLKALLEYTSSADLGVVLIEDACRSYHLSLPNKIFEYIQAGIPVIGSDLPEIARLITEEGIGLLVNPDIIESIVEGIEYILENPPAYATMRENVSKAAQIYNWENESQKLLNLYAKI